MATAQELLRAYNPGFVGFESLNEMAQPVESQSLVSVPAGESPGREAHGGYAGGASEEDGYYADFAEQLEAFVRAHPLKEGGADVTTASLLFGFERDRPSLAPGGQGGGEEESSSEEWLEEGSSDGDGGSVADEAADSAPPGVHAVAHAVAPTTPDRLVALDEYATEFLSEGRAIGDNPGHLGILDFVEPFSADDDAISTTGGDGEVSDGGSDDGEVSDGGSDDGDGDGDGSAAEDSEGLTFVTLGAVAAEPLGSAAEGSDSLFAEFTESM